MYRNVEEAREDLLKTQQIIINANKDIVKFEKMEKRFLELINGLKHEYTIGNIIARNDNDQDMFSYDSKNKQVWLSYDRILSVFYSEFNLNDHELQRFITGMVEKYMNCKGFTIYESFL